MSWLILVILMLIGCFGFVLLYGAPYLPTLSKQVGTALDITDLKPGQTLFELGCGDGKVLLAAAERGWKVIGYELNPVMAAIAWLRTRRYHKSGQVRIVCGNFWNADLAQADAIFVFLLDKYMLRLNTKIVQECKHPVKLVSFAFQVPGKQANLTQDGLYLYSYN